MLVVAKRYGLSDVGLAKLCRRAQIPVSPRGCWAQLRAGKSVRRSALPRVGENALAFLSLPRISHAGRAGASGGRHRGCGCFAAGEVSLVPDRTRSGASASSRDRPVGRALSCGSCRRVWNAGSSDAPPSGPCQPRESPEGFTSSEPILPRMRCPRLRLRLEGDQGYEKACGPTAPLRSRASERSIRPRSFKADGKLR
jgi:hypothetical protein